MIPARAVLQPDGKVIAAGGSGDAFVVARYNINGSLDATFDGDGIVETRFPLIGRHDVVLNGFSSAQSVALQSDGKLLAGGYSDYFGGTVFSVFTLARYNPNGSLDA